MTDKCTRTGNKLELCASMENEVESLYGIFQRCDLEKGRVLILMNDVQFIYFCPYCGGKVAEE